MASSFDSTLSSLGISRGVTSPVVSPASINEQSLGQGDFLTLLTAQLKNQDPFSPVDNTQMVAQLAQFSSVSGISEINSTLRAISDKLAQTSGSEALSYVGHTVLTPGNTAFPRVSGGIAGAVDIDRDASDVRISIQTPGGEILKTISLGKQTAGTVEFDWDGLTESGAPAGDGPFIVSTVASNNGKAVGSRPLVWAPVASVSVPANGEPLLTLPGIGQVAASAVRQIS